MIAAETKLSGPLFERDVAASLLLANVRASQEVGERLGTALRAAYSGGIVRRGPGRFGHVADSIRRSTSVSGETVTTRVFPSGRAAFKAVFLERGTRGPHRGGRSGVLLPREKRDRAARARGHAAALKIGSIFRRSAQPHGAPAFRVAERTLAQQWPALQPIYAQEIGKELGSA